MTGSRQALVHTQANNRCIPYCYSNMPNINVHAYINLVFTVLFWERLFVHTPEEAWAHWACWRSKALLPGHVILCQRQGEWEHPPACIFWGVVRFNFQFLASQTPPELSRAQKGVTCLFRRLLSHEMNSSSFHMYWPFLELQLAALTPHCFLSHYSFHTDMKQIISSSCVLRY